MMISDISDYLFYFPVTAVSLESNIFFILLPSGVLDEHQFTEFTYVAPQGDLHH